jgi:hypothetical protein
MIPKSKLLRALEELISGSKNTSFVLADNRPHVRFDALRISPQKQYGSFGGKKYNDHKFTFEILLENEVIFEQQIPQGIYFSEGDTLTLSDLNGLIPINIS